MSHSKKMTNYDSHHDFYYDYDFYLLMNSRYVDFYQTLIYYDFRMD